VSKSRQVSQAAPLADDRPEFALIETWFAPGGRGGFQAGRHDVALGIGDDAALVRTDPETPLVTGVATRHGSEMIEPERCAEHLFDEARGALELRGAEARWLTLALTLPALDAGWRQWVERFSRSLSVIAARHRATLIGGDTTSGACCVTLSLHGQIPPR